MRELREVEIDFLDWISDELERYGDVRYYADLIIYKIISNHDPEHKTLEHEDFKSIEELDSSIDYRKLGEVVKNFLHFAYYDGYTDGEISLIMTMLEFLRETKTWELYYTHVSIWGYSECKRLDRKLRKLERKNSKKRG